MNARSWRSPRHRADRAEEQFELIGKCSNCSYCRKEQIRRDEERLEEHRQLIMPQPLTLCWMAPNEVIYLVVASGLLLRTVSGFCALFASPPSLCIPNHVPRECTRRWQNRDMLNSVRDLAWKRDVGLSVSF